MMMTWNILRKGGGGGRGGGVGVGGGGGVGGKILNWIH